MPFCIIYTTVCSRVADSLAKILKHDYLSKAAKMKAASVVNSIKRRKEHLPIMHCGNYSHFWLLSSIDTISSRHRRDSRLCQTSYGSSPSFWYTKQGGPLPGKSDGWKKGKVMLIKIAKKSSTSFFESSHEKKWKQQLSFYIWRKTLKAHIEHMAKDPFWEVNNIWWPSGKNINILDVNDDVQNLRDSRGIIIRSVSFPM